MYCNVMYQHTLNIIFFCWDGVPPLFFSLQLQTNQSPTFAYSLHHTKHWAMKMNSNTFALNSHSYFPKTEHLSWTPPRNLWASVEPAGGIKQWCTTELPPRLAHATLAKQNSIRLRTRLVTKPQHSGCMYGASVFNGWVDLTPSNVLDFKQTVNRAGVQGQRES